MARALFVAFPDKREGDAPFIEVVNPALGTSRASTAGFSPLSYSGRWPTAWWLKTALAVDPQLVLNELKGVAWQHPLLLAWRLEEEDAWQFEVLAGASAPEAEAEIA